MEKLYYISQGETPGEHLQNIRKACEAGCKWIQLRLKDVDMVIALQTALACRTICDDFEAVMIVNDSVGIAQAAQADGIHLGLLDMDVKGARKIVGDNFIIGATANTEEECIQHIKDGVDYIGLGPYRLTTTKKNLSPVLGLKGYQNILRKDSVVCKSKIPVVAIGGITLVDFKDLYASGIASIAVSGLLTGKKKEEIASIIDKAENGI